MPAVTKVKNTPEAASTIIIPAESFAIFFSPFCLESDVSGVNNLIVVENNTSITHTRGKQKSASTQNKKDKTVELNPPKHFAQTQQNAPKPQPSVTQISANATDMRLKINHEPIAL
jgi:hypothetical protein